MSSGETPEQASEDGRRRTQLDAQLRAVYAALPVGAAFVTPDLRYERVNEALARINGRTVEEHVGHSVHEVLGEHGAEAERIAHEVIRTGQPVEVQLRLRTPAAPDEDRAFAATYFPVFDPADDAVGAGDGALLGIGAIVRDITDREVHERERERLLGEALIARAQAEAAQVRAEAVQEEIEAALAEARGQREIARAAGQRAAFLATVTGRLAASLDYETTLREVVASAVPYLADWGLVTAVEPGGHVRVLGFAHRDPARAKLGDTFAGRYLPGPRSSVREVIRTGEAVIEEDVGQERLATLAPNPGDTAQLAQLGLRHFATLPISSPDGVIIGTLTFVLGESGRRFSPESLQTARVVATRAGLHLTNARLHRERSEIARTLQASLLPRELPRIPGIDLASAFVAAGGENIVGGDFFDVFPSGDGVWTAILGDVTGKGARAAAITATARHTLRAAALLGTDPADNLALLDRVLLADGDAQPCTVVYARLRPEGGRLAMTLAHAGHPPAVVLRRDGTATPVSGGRGPLLGALPGGRFEETDLVLDAGEVIVLYTDGVTEARPRNVALGEQVLASTLTTTRGLPAGEVAEAVRSTTLGLQGGTPRDDIAVLVFRVPADSDFPRADG